MKTQETTYNSKQNSFRIVTILILSGLLGTASICLAQSDTWTQKADMPAARFILSASAVDGKIYAIGGSSAMHGAGLSIVDEYDPTTDTWTTKAPMPTPRQWLSTSVVNGKIYAIGGDARAGAPSLSTVEVYDPATDTWTEKAPMLIPRFALSTSVVDGKIYAIGGWLRPPERVISDVEVYDPATDTWTTKASMPTARNPFFSTSVVDGKIYAIGGWLRPPERVISDVEVYDPATDTWTKKAPMPTARAALSTSVVDGKIYAIGGTTYRAGLSTVEVYDPATDTWTTKASMPTARNPFLSTPVVDGIIYVIGGTSGETAFSTVEAYDPATDTWTEKTSMPGARGSLATSVVGGKIYVIGGTPSTHGAPMSTVEEYDATPPLVVDFNGDGIVDSADMCIMVDHWHTDYPLCDIAPPPSGDGIVDVQDLILLSEHLFEDYRMVAHWKLDETEGMIAHDDVGGCDGNCYGEPLWQPADGKVTGALDFDGMDDYVGTDFIQNPEDGSFSAFAWIKGGAPGQVILSQVDRPAGRTTILGSTWLGTDPSNGRLVTSLMGHPFGPLESQVIITDGQWHHVGLVYALDGLQRRLYVDGVEVAGDTAFVDGVLSDGSLHFGAGKNLSATSFWLGLIDDIRIYPMALNPEQIAALVQ